MPTITLLYWWYLSWLLIYLSLDSITFWSLSVELSMSLSLLLSLSLSLSRCDLFRRSVTSSEHVLFSLQTSISTSSLKSCEELTPAVVVSQLWVSCYSTAKMNLTLSLLSKALTLYWNWNLLETELLLASSYFTSFCAVLVLKVFSRNERMIKKCK